MTNALRLSNLVVRCSDPTVNSSVLICHGLLGSKQNWKSVSHTLAQKKCGTVVAVDLRNHGNSPHSDSMSYLHMSKDISKVVDDLKLQQVCLLGHSMGGKAVMCASLMTPEKYDKLVVLDISPVTKPSVQSLYPIVDLLSSVNLEEIGRKCGGNLAAVRSFLMEDWKEAVPDFTMRAFLLTNLEVKDRKVFWRVNLNAIKNCWQQIKSFPEKELSGRVFDRPTLVLAASKGDYLSASDVPAIRKYFPQAQILQIANTGHWIHFDAPNTVISLLTSFMQKESIDVTSYTDVTELK